MEIQKISDKRGVQTKIKKKKSEHNSHKVFISIRKGNIGIMGSQGGEEWEKGIENLKK